MSNNADFAKLMRESEKNIASELVCFNDMNAKWDWLLTHMEVYLVRLQEVCFEFRRPPRKFMETSIFFNLIVAVDLAEHLLILTRNTPPEWTSFRASINDLSEAEDVSNCLLCWKSICELKL